MSELGPVRPSFELSAQPSAKDKVERLIAGTKYHGMMIDITPEGMKLNAYYTGFVDADKKYAVLRDPVIIPWEELERLKEQSEKPEDKKKAKLDRVETEIDEEYLAGLTKITINKKKYYIDTVRRERRSVEKPTEVWRF